MTGGFLLAIIAAALTIILAAPQYAEPAAGGIAEVESSAPSPGLESAQVMVEPEVMTSKPPTRLKGYRWPVRGGQVDTYYARDKSGDFEIKGKPVHDGLIITWFEGATVKAAHAGKVVAAGRDWAEHVGYHGSLDKVYARYAGGSAKKSAKKKGKKKPPFPLGIVIDDGNGYYSVYSEIDDLRVKVDEEVKAGQTIGAMSRAEGKQMMRYRLVRMDGPPMKVREAARERGYPDYARERVDPLAVLNLDAKRMPKTPRKPPRNPPRLSEY